MQRVVQYEMTQMNLKEPVMITARSSGRIPYMEFECITQFRHNRIVWESEAVELYHPYEILMEILMALQQFKWYQTLDEETKRVVCMESETETDAGVPQSRTSDSKTARLLIQHLKGANSMLAYDVLTGAYAQAKSDWYCGF